MKKDKPLARVMYYCRIIGANLLVLGLVILLVTWIVLYRYGSVRNEAVGRVAGLVFWIGLAMFLAGQLYIKEYLRENSSAFPVENSDSQPGGR